jgi:hypothetical protein
LLLKQISEGKAITFDKRVWSVKSTYSQLDSYPIWKKSWSQSIFAFWETNSKVARVSRYSFKFWRQLFEWDKILIDRSILPQPSSLSIEICL